MWGTSPARGSARGLFGATMLAFLMGSSSTHPASKLDSSTGSSRMDGSSHGKARFETRQRTSTVNFSKRKETGYDQLPALNSFDVLYKLGEGGFGKVLLTRKKDTQELFAIKSISKQRINAADAEYVIGESEALQHIRHRSSRRWVPSRTQYLYFVFEFIGGGDLYERAHNTFPIMHRHMADARRSTTSTTVVHAGN